MQHDYSQFQKQMKKRLLPLAIAAIGGGGVAPLWAQTMDTLDTVVVTASRVLEAKREISSNVTIIDEEDIKASTATSLADLMVQQGFLVATTGDTSPVQIRGMGGLSMPNELENSVLILLNGRRIGNANLALAGLANVKRVEIIRGPAAVQYGSSALGGIINVITKQGKDAKPFISLEAGFGSDSLKREKLAFGGSANGFDFAFGGTNLSRDDVTVSNDRRWYHTAIDKDQIYNLDLGYTFNKNHRVGINYNYGNIKSELSDGSGMGGIRPFSSNTPDAPYDNYKKINENTALSYTGSTDSKNLDWLVNYSFGNDTQKVNDPLSGALESKNKIDNEMFNAQLNYNAQFFSLSGGVDQIKYDTSVWSVWSPNITVKGKMKDTGVYVTGKLRFLDENLILSFGLRRDKYKNTSNVARSKSDSHTGGSIGVSYLPTNWLKLRANYAEGFKMPSPAQISGDSWTIANSSLAPEKSKTYEFGADISWNHLNGSLTWFHSDWKDKIIGKQTPNGRQNVNLKDVRLAGLEGSLSYDLGKAFKQNYSLTPYANFTYLGTRKNKDPREYIPYNGLSNTMPNTPKWMAAYGIDYAHPGLKLKTRLNANYYGKVITQDWSKQVAYVAPYFSRPSGTVVNWSLEKELSELSGQYGRLTLRTEVNNLFDKANEMWWSYPGPGRSFYVGLRYDY